MVLDSLAGATVQDHHRGLPNNGEIVIEKLSTSRFTSRRTTTCALRELGTQQPAHGKSHVAPALGYVFFVHLQEDSDLAIM